MAGISLFNDMVQGIADRGRRLLTTGVRSGGRVEQSAMSVEALCDMLLSSRGEASGIALAAEIFHRWSRMDPAGQQAFVQMLYGKFGPDMAKLDKAIKRFDKDKGPDAITALHQAAEPRRQELVRRLNLAPKGTAKLVEMRERLLGHEECQRRIPRRRCRLLTSAGFLVQSRISDAAAHRLVHAGGYPGKDH